MASKKSFDARIKQRFSVVCGPSAGAAVAAVPDSINAESINALLPSELFTCFLVPAQSDMYMEYCVLEETCIFCPLLALS